MIQKSLENILNNICKGELKLFRGFDDDWNPIYLFIRYNGPQTLKMWRSSMPFDFEYGYKREYKCRVEYLINQYDAIEVDINEEQKNHQDEIF